MKLRTGLFSLVAGALVPVLLLALLLGILLIDHERETFRRGALDRNRAFMSAVDTAILGHIATLQALSTSNNLEKGNVAAFQSRLERILQSQPDWQDVTLSTPDGRRIADAAVPGTDAPPADVESVVRAATTRKPTVGLIALRPATGRYGVAVRYPILVRGEVAYVLSAIVDPGPFQRLIEAQQLPAGWISGLVDASQHFVACVPPRSPDDRASPEFRRRIEGLEEGWYRGRTIEGKDTFTAFRTSALTGWSIGLAIPAEIVTAPSRRATWTLAASTIVALLLAFGIAWLVGGRIAGPIASLAAAARSVGRGEKPAPHRVGKIEELRDVDRALAESWEAIQERSTLREREQAALREADRAKDEFIAILGHELRNPLSAITNSVHLLRAAPPGGQAEARARDVIERQARQMTRLVEDLLDISRLSTGKLVLHRQPVDLGEIVARLVETWCETRRLAPDRVRLHRESAVVVGDRARLEQVVANLLDNANKFSPRDHAIDVSVQARDGFAVLAVADRGEGIDPAMLESVFRPFVQGPQDAHRPVGGLGLGLAVVQRIVELHEGAVSAASEGRGLGATFTVRIPLSEAAAIDPAPRAQARVS